LPVSVAFGFLSATGSVRQLLKTNDETLIIHRDTLGKEALEQRGVNVVDHVAGNESRMDHELHHEQQKTHAAKTSQWMLEVCQLETPQLIRVSDCSHDTLFFTFVVRQENYELEN
jgi:hypothetical protein